MKFEKSMKWANKKRTVCEVIRECNDIIDKERFVNINNYVEVKNKLEEIVLPPLVIKEEISLPEYVVFHRVDVPGNIDWTDSGLDVVEGQELRFQASGGISLQEGNPLAVSYHLGDANRADHVDLVVSSDCRGHEYPVVGLQEHVVQSDLARRSTLSAKELLEVHVQELVPTEDEGLAEIRDFGESLG